MTLRMRFPAFVAALWFVFPAMLLGEWVKPASTQPTEFHSSPDGKTAAVWFDADLGEQIGWVRTVLVTPIPRGNPVFSLVTFPRWTLVAWNISSSRCLIVDAPDNGNVNFWLLERKEKEKWKTTRINPVDSLAGAFYSDSAWNGHQLWRPGVESLSWLDDRTLRLNAVDNKGVYEITLQVDNPERPHIKKISSKADKK